MTSASGRPWIINLGLPKSGTTTFQTALERAGLSATGHLLPGPGRRPVARALFDAYFETGDPLSGLSGLDGLGEVSILRRNLSLWPQCDFGLLQALKRNHPKIRLVATWRPYIDIVDSMHRWRNLGTQRLPNGSVPGLPAGYGAPKAQLAWVQAHDQFLQTIFAGDPTFLRLDVTAPDAQDSLARHIGRPIPWWGRANVGRQRPK